MWQLSQKQNLQNLDNLKKVLCRPFLIFRKSKENSRKLTKSDKNYTKSSSAYVKLNLNSL